jgi:hypothetical protein
MTTFFARRIFPDRGAESHGGHRDTFNIFPMEAKKLSILNFFSPTVNPDQIIFQARACTLLFSVTFPCGDSDLADRRFLRAIHRKRPIPDNIDNPPPHRANVESLSELSPWHSTLLDKPAPAKSDSARGSNLRWTGHQVMAATGRRTGGTTTGAGTTGDGATISRVGGGDGQGI